MGYSTDTSTVSDIDEHSDGTEHRIDLPHSTNDQSAAEQPSKKALKSRANRKQPNGVKESLIWHNHVWSWRVHLFSWHYAFSWTIGSMIFVVSSTALLFKSITENKPLSIDFGIVSLVGAFLYTFGALCQVLEVLQSPVNYDIGKGLVMKNGTYLKNSDTTSYPDTPESERHPEEKVPRNGFQILADDNIDFSKRFAYVFLQHRRIDYVLSVLILIGAILFNICTFVQVGWWKQYTEPGMNDPLYYGVNVSCDIVGCGLFTIAGYLTVVEATESVWPTWQPRNPEWWATNANIVGGLGFTGNGVLWLFYYSSADLPYAQIPLLIGSIAYTFSSGFAWWEQCVAQ